MNKNDVEINDIIAEAMSKKANAKKQPEIAKEPEHSSFEEGKKPDRSDMVFNYGDDDTRDSEKGRGNSNSGKNDRHGKRKSSNGRRGKKKSVKKTVIIVLLVILLILIIAVVVAYAFIMSKINKINLVDRGYDNSIVDSISEAPPEEENPNNEPDSPDSDIDDLNSQIDEIINNAVPLKFSDDVYNILLIGTDPRQPGERGRSDSMILVSINKKSEQIIMTSIMRDIYTAIPGKSNNRINAAYSWGGPDLLIQTIENDFKVRIDKFVMVNFGSFEKVIDAVGGVDIYVNDAEMSIMKEYLGDAYHGADTYHLDGRQALRYARIRYVGNADFERTQRQRRILQEIMKSAEKLSMSEMNDWLDVILPLLTTDLEKGEILDIILHSASYLKYERVEQRIPADGTWWNMRINGMAVLGIDFEENRQRMIKTIYGEE